MVRNFHLFFNHGIVGCTPGPTPMGNPYISPITRGYLCPLIQSTFSKHLQHIYPPSLDRSTQAAPGRGVSGETDVDVLIAILLRIFPTGGFQDNKIGEK